MQKKKETEDRNDKKKCVIGSVSWITFAVARIQNKML